MCITTEIWALARYFKAVQAVKTLQGLDHIFVLCGVILSYCQTNKITNMSNLREKAIEIAKQTSSESAFMCGYDRACKEYEEKLRWIPVEEKLPENKELVLVKTNRNCVSTAYLHGKLSGFITYGEEAFVDFGSITHWRSIFL